MRRRRADGAPGAAEVPRRPHPLIRVFTFRDCTSLPPAFEPVFADPRTGQLFRTRSWLDAFARSGIDAGSRFRLYAIESDGTPLAVLPAVVSRLYRAHPRARVLHFIQAEGDPYAPFAASDSPDWTRILRGLLECIRAERRRCDVLRVSPLDPESPFARQLIKALRGRGYPLQAFRHLDDRYEATEGVSAQAYLSTRPSELRSMLRTTGQPLFDSGRAAFRLITAASELDAAREAYEAVLEQDPAEAEAEPEGHASNIMRVAAEVGALRLGVIDFDGRPAAVQLWIVSARSARCIRICSDPAHAALPLDDMATERLAAHLLDVDRASELDFGSVDSDFAQNWAPRTRQRIGVIAFNPRTWRGIKGTVRHILIPKVLAVPRRIRRRMLGRG
jgi:hypothetical protein